MKTFASPAAPGQRATDPPAPTSPSTSPQGLALAQLELAIDRRFLEEVQNLREAGCFKDILHLSELLGVHRNLFAKIGKGEQHARPAHVRRLKDVFNADYHYVLFGVPDPDPVRRGAYKKPAGKLTHRHTVQELEGWINYRFVKEVERMEREGRVINRQWMAEQLGVYRNLFISVRRGTAKVNAAQVVMLKQVFNADYHFILWGYERAEISMPKRVVNGSEVRLDVFRKYTFSYTNEPKWHPVIPERDPEDESKRLHREYYMDLPTLNA